MAGRPVAGGGIFALALGAIIEPDRAGTILC
jgi:hypothetical protein